MTRYARVAHKQRTHLSGATPWSNLAGHSSSLANADTTNVQLKQDENTQDQAVRSDHGTESLSKKVSKKTAVLKRVGKRSEMEHEKTSYKQEKAVKRRRKNSARDGDHSTQTEKALNTYVPTSTTASLNENKCFIACTKQTAEGEVPVSDEKDVSGKEGNRTDQKNIDQVLFELFEVNSLSDVKEHVRKMTKEGRIQKGDAGEIIRRWRKHYRQVNFKQTIQERRTEALESLSNSLENGYQTLDDLKRIVNDYVQSGKVFRKDAADIIKKWKSRERRRINRKMGKEQSSCCFLCRLPGHKFSECPQKDEQTMGTGVCFKCGSAEHSSTRCQRKNIRGYPYAVCFICKQQGHLSSSCDKNTNGIYPNGGSCNLCGSLYHLKKDCPELQLMKKEEPKWGCLLRTNDAVEGGDDDIIENEEKQKTKSMPLKTKKIIRF